MQTDLFKKSLSCILQLIATVRTALDIDNLIHTTNLIIIFAAEHTYNAAKNMSAVYCEI